jgi:hypothetical protein
MSRTRLILAGLLAMLIVGVVASASATEPPAKCGGTVASVPDYCVAGFELENSKGEPVSETIEGKNGKSTLKTTIAMVNTEIECQKGKSPGTIEDGAGGTVGKSLTTITFEECKLLKPAHCKLTVADEKEIKTTVLKGAQALTAGRIEDKLEPREGAFATVSIEGKEETCVIAEVEKPQSYNVTGSQLCEIDTSNAEAENETEKHKIICKSSGSGLKIGTNGVEITDEATVVLTGSKAHASWSIKQDA